MKKILSFFAAALFAGSVMAGSFVKVTDASTLAAGDEIIIVNVDGDKALSTTQNSNNRGAADVTLTDDTIVPGEAVQVIKLEAAEANFKLNVGEDAYLYAASNSSNHLKTANAETVGANGEFLITIEEGVAAFTAQGTNARNSLRYNPNNGNPMFSCYASNTSVTAGLQIFKKVASEEGSEGEGGEGEGGEGEGGEEESAEWKEIKFDSVVVADDLAEDAVFAVEDSTFKVTVTDPDNKMSIDANSCRFGDAEAYVSYSHRLKTGGKTTSNKNYMTFTISEDGFLRFAVRTGSNSDTTRTLIVKQGADSLYKEVVRESQAIKVMEDSTEVSVYPYVTVPVKAGEVSVTYPVNGLNFYAFAFMADEEEPGLPAPTNCVEAAEAALSVSANNDLYNDGAEYTIEGYVTEIAYNYSASTNNMSFWMADEADGGKVLEAYKVVPESADAIPGVGDKVAVTGKLTRYNSTPEFAAGCTCVILEKSAIVPENLGEKTIGEFLELKNDFDTCVLTGVVTQIVNTQYGNLYLADETDTVYVYGVLTADGQSQQFASLNVEEGDTLTILATYSEYKNTPQIKNAVFVAVRKNVETAIDNIETKKEVVKTLRNGILIIKKNDVEYTATGLSIR